MRKLSKEYTTVSSRMSERIVTQEWYKKGGGLTEDFLEKEVMKTCYVLKYTALGNGPVNTL